MKYRACVLALALLTGCTPDEDILRDKVPSLFNIVTLESKDFHFLNCFRATYLVGTVPDGALQAPSVSVDGRIEFSGWQNMESIGSSSFRRCVDADEEALWQPSIDAGLALEAIHPDIHLRVWYDPARHRLLVLAYQP
ncbi:MAG: hypothetical protein B7Z10_05950 [Rhodobacterales bacterium 32-66-7]|nr:MAG: hypothetical protein B7Z31_07790 [Rhodobacterales bacterium 12-65-15]OYX25566.1 MAG: hypothetical protein B7Z10_05950 [Rhodobacterales bacterium 32-66-7]